MALLERQIDRLLTPLPADEDVDPEAEMAEDRRRVSQALELLKVGAPPRKCGLARSTVKNQLWWNTPRPLSADATPASASVVNTPESDRPRSSSMAN